MTPESTPGAVVALFRKDGKILAVSRKGRTEDLGLVGGKIDPGETPLRAIVREIWEEVGVVVADSDLDYIFERVDIPTGHVAWCYTVKAWEGEPYAKEPGTRIAWVTPEELLVPECMFRDYNRSLFTFLKIVIPSSTVSV